LPAVEIEAVVARLADERAQLARGQRADRALGMHLDPEQDLVLDDVADAGEHALVEQRVGGDHAGPRRELATGGRRVPRIGHHVAAPVVIVVHVALAEHQRAGVEVQLAVVEGQAQAGRGVLAALVHAPAAPKHEVDAQVEAGELQQQVLAPAVQREQALAVHPRDRQPAVADHLAHDVADELVGLLAQDDKGRTFRHGASLPPAGSWPRGCTCVAYTARMNAASDADPALQALWLPFVDGALAWPGRGLFLGARDGWPLHQRAWPGLACVQSFRPAFDALERAGLSVSQAPPPGERWPLVLLLPPRQREAARALFVQAATLLSPGGRIVAAMPNAEGAKSGEADLARLAGPLEVLSKHKCRVFWTA